MCVCVYLASNFSRLVEGLKVYIDIFLSIKVFGKFHLSFIFYFYIIVIYIYRTISFIPTTREIRHFE